jgi:uncharacterized membrane protein
MDCKKKIIEFWDGLSDCERYILASLASALFALLLINLVKLFVIAILIVTAIALRHGYSYAKTKQMQGLFWLWGCICVVFLVTIFICKARVTLYYKEQADATNTLCITLSSNYDQAVMVWKNV